MPAPLYWIASYPKSGNTWLRLFLGQLLFGDGEARLADLAIGGMFGSRAWVDEVLGIGTADLSSAELARLRPIAHAWMANELEQPLFEKVHDACERTATGRLALGSPPRAAVYLLRNPLDVAPSAAHHWGTSLDRAIDLLGNASWSLCARDGVLSEQLPQRLGHWSRHVLSWVEAPPFPLLVLRYEDLHADPQGSFERAAAFLGLQASPADVEDAWRRCTFDELAAKEAAEGFAERGLGDRFFRQGRVGGWRDVLDASQVARVVAQHGSVMRRFGYLEDNGQPV